MYKIGINCVCCNHSHEWSSPHLRADAKDKGLKTFVNWLVKYTSTAISVLHLLVVLVIMAPETRKSIVFELLQNVTQRVCLWRCSVTKTYFQTYFRFGNADNLLFTNCVSLMFAVATEKGQRVQLKKTQVVREGKKIFRFIREPLLNFKAI